VTKFLPITNEQSKDSWIPAAWKAVIILSFILVVTATFAFLIYHASSTTAIKNLEDEDEKKISAQNQPSGRIPRQGKSLLNMKMSFVQEEGSISDLVPLENWYPIPKSPGDEYPLDFEITTVNEERDETTLRVTTTTSVSPNQKDEGITEKIFVILPAEIVEENEKLETGKELDRSDEITQNPDVTLDKILLHNDENEGLQMENNDHEFEEIDGFVVGDRGHVKTLEEELEEILQNEYQTLLEEKTMKSYETNLGPVERLLQLLQQSLLRSKSRVKTNEDVSQFNFITQGSLLVDSQTELSTTSSTTADIDKETHLFSLESLANEYQAPGHNTELSMSGEGEKSDMNEEIFKKISNYNFHDQTYSPSDQQDVEGPIKTLEPIVVNTELKLNNFSSKEGEENSSDLDEEMHWMLPTPNPKSSRKSGLRKKPLEPQSQSSPQITPRVELEDPGSDIGTSFQSLLTTMNLDSIDSQEKDISMVDVLSLEGREHLIS